MVGVRAQLEIEIFTPHGEPVPGATVLLTAGRAPRVAAEIRRGVHGADLQGAGEYLLIVERSGAPGGFDHRPLRATLALSLRGGAIELSAADAPGAGSRIGEIQEKDGIFRVHVTLDYLWFTPIGYPPTLENRVDVLVDGEETWRSVAEAIAGSVSAIHATTWIYQPTTELLRPDPLAEPSARAQNAVQNILQERADTGVTVRLLLWDAPVLQLPAPLRRAGETLGDRFEVMEEANPTRKHLFRRRWGLANGLFGRFPIGSQHQKTLTVDGRVGFCGGMNIKENDWDTREHLLFDPRRCAFSRSAAFRAQVAARTRLPDYPPRHDFMARLEGPSVAHMEESFRERWNRLIDRGARYAAQASRVPAPAPRPPAGPSQVQVVRTMPPPLMERGILDVYRRAVAAARRLIYIEDQYFRSALISKAIAEAARATPGLEVIVVTTERQANDLFAGGWSHRSFERIRAVRPLFELYSLRVYGEDADGRRALRELDNHAKLLIVDDAFVLVGSCNVNDRGFELDAEMDLAVADPDLARRLRVDLWRDHLGGDPRIGGDIEADLAVWREHAEANRGYDPRAAGGPPAGHIFPFVPAGRRWTIFGARVV